MSTLTYAVRGSATLTRRNLKHLVRYPSLTVTIIAMPVIFLLLFVYVFGGTLGAGLPGGAGSADPRGDYLQYLTPAILVMTVVAVAQSTAILIAKDATEGIIDRFRTMPIARSASSRSARNRSTGTAAGSTASVRCSLPRHCRWPGPVPPRARSSPSP